MILVQSRWGGEAYRLRQSAVQISIFRGVITTYLAALINHAGYSPPIAALLDIAWRHGLGWKYMPCWIRRPLQRKALLLEQNEIDLEKMAQSKHGEGERRGNDTNVQTQEVKA